MVGGLAAYGPNLHDPRHAAMFVDKALKGTSVGDIPVERASSTRSSTSDRQGTRPDDPARYWRRITSLNDRKPRR